MRKLLNRLKEPSTYAGLTGFLVLIGVGGFSESEWQVLFNGLAGVAAVVAMVLKDPGSEE